MYIISMIYRCRIIVNDGQPTTFLPATVKQLFQIGVGKLSSREYTRTSKLCDSAVIFVHEDNQRYCGFIEKFVVTSGKVNASVLVLNNVIDRPAPHLLKYSYPLSRYIGY